MSATTITRDMDNANSMTRSKSKAAVRIRDARKRYPNTVVFEGLDMTVPEGTIYCLLGPSGCGKTTLLNCVVGRSLLDSGSIQLSIHKRSELGFMPQATCLYQNLSVYETFFLFGYVFGMSREKIKKRAAELIKFLNIPSATRQVKTFSGGEQRRVSVAVTFLHDPKVLVLDEPTVGLDPLLCNSIWDYLLELSSKGKTILITTHYIQEARQAHTVGLMRHGILLAEDKPIQLLIKYDTNNLEEVFLKLCLQQRQQKDEVSNEYDHEDIKPSKPVGVHFEEDDALFSFTKFRAINYKNSMILKRAFVFVIFLFLLPFSQIYFFNVTIGRRPKHLSLAVVNEEIPISECGHTRSSNGCFLEGNRTIALSCLYLDVMRKETYEFIEYSSTSTALNDVRKNVVWALLYFRQNYTESLVSRFSYGNRASEIDVTNSNIDTWIDLSNQYIGNFIKYDMARFSKTVMEQAFVNCGLNPKLGAPPLSMETPIFGSYTEEFVSYASSATLCLCCFFMPFLLTGGLIFIEKYEGLLERLVITGVSMREIMASMIVYQIIVLCIQTAGMMYMNYIVFGNTLNGNVVTLVSLLLFIGIAGALYGLLLAGISDNINMISYSGIGSNLLLIFTSGIIWPVEAGHYVLKSVSNFIPLTSAVNAIRGICAKSYPLMHPMILKGFFSIFAWASLFLLFIFLITKFRKSAWIVKK